MMLAVTLLILFCPRTTFCVSLIFGSRVCLLCALWMFHCCDLKQFYVLLYLDGTEAVSQRAKISRKTNNSQAIVVRVSFGDRPVVRAVRAAVTGLLQAIILESSTAAIPHTSPGGPILRTISALLRPATADVRCGYTRPGGRCKWWNAQTLLKL
jgi:hypothetical protein